MLCAPLPETARAQSGLADLVYELLDAHLDTMRLAEPLAQTSEWAAHLDYLRGLQRVGRERLARLETAEPPIR